MSFLSDLKKPVNFISISLGIIGIILAIVFYFKSQKEKIPTYILPEPNEISIVYDSQKSSPSIRVLDKDSTLVKDNVYLFTATFWNSGNLPIEPEDVRTPVVLTISPCKKILDYKIVAATYPDIANFTLTEIKSVDSLSKSLMLKWNHLDPNFGLMIQVTHTGSLKPWIKFNGMIVGVEGLKNGKTHTQSDKLLFNAFLSLICLAVLAIVIKSESLFNKYPRIWFSSVIIFSLFAYAIVAFMIYKMYIDQIYYGFVHHLTPLVN